MSFRLSNLLLVRIKSSYPGVPAPLLCLLKKKKAGACLKKAGIVLKSHVPGSKHFRILSWAFPVA